MTHGGTRFRRLDGLGNKKEWSNVNHTQGTGGNPSVGLRAGTRALNHASLGADSTAMGSRRLLSGLHLDPVANPGAAHKSW